MKALADTLSHHFGTSVFKGWDSTFWDAQVAWQYHHFLPLTRYPVDGWHLANSAMILFFLLSVMTYQRLTKWYFELLVYGALFNLIFNLFYDHILR